MGQAWGQESCENRWRTTVFLRVAPLGIVFRMQPESIRLSVLGIRQLPCPELGYRICNMDF